jgi:mitogen-activated protein kinase kinase kinase 13
MRQVSGSSIASTSKSSGSRRGKGRQVEFSDDVRVHVSRGSSQEADEESELTDLTELEEEAEMATPRPNRVRGKSDKGKGRVPKDEGSVDELGRRKTPMRKAKGKVGSLKESDTEEEDQLLGEEVENDQEEEEVDELVSSPSPTPPPLGRRTPLRRRLRPRQTLTQTATPPSEDDEDNVDENGEEGDAEDGEDDEQEEVDEGEETAVEVTPKKLRSGKIVGEEDMEDEDAEQDEDGDEDGEQVEEEVNEADLDAEGEDEDEVMDDGELT